MQRTGGLTYPVWPVMHSLLKTGGRVIIAKIWLGFLHSAFWHYLYQARGGWQHRDPAFKFLLDSICMATKCTQDVYREALTCKQAFMNKNPHTEVKVKTNTFLLLKQVETAEIQIWDLVWLPRNQVPLVTYYSYIHGCIWSPGKMRYALLSLQSGWNIQMLC